MRLNDKINNNENIKNEKEFNDVIDSSFDE